MVNRQLPLTYSIQLNAEELSVTHSASLKGQFWSNYTWGDSFLMYDSACIAAAVCNGSRRIFGCLGYLHPTKRQVFLFTDNVRWIFKHTQRGLFSQGSGQCCKISFNTKSHAIALLTRSASLQVVNSNLFIYTNFYVRLCITKQSGTFVGCKFQFFLLDLKC